MVIKRRLQFTSYFLYVSLSWNDYRAHSTSLSITNGNKKVNAVQITFLSLMHLTVKINESNNRTVFYFVVKNNGVSISIIDDSIVRVLLY